MVKKITGLAVLFGLFCSFSLAQSGEVQIVEVGDIVTVEYIGSLAKNQKVFDTSDEKVAKENNIYQPTRDYTKGIIFTAGAGQMIPGFDQGVIGMHLEETKKMTLSPKDAYGERDPANTQAVPLTGLPKKTNNTPYVAGDEIISMVGPIKIISISGTNAIFDMNHPLAGETLVFTVTVKKISTTEGKQVTDKQTGDDTSASTVPKTRKPIVELFVMSYCPYGLQAEKGFLDVMKKFRNKADIKVKFVHYLMHGEKERDENTRQRCIQKDQKTKYPTYLSCFLNAGDTQTCLTKAKVNLIKLNGCTKLMNERYTIMTDFTTGGQYPKYGINATESQKAGVQGSPTLVINGVKIENVGRSATDYKEAICAAFIKKPALCTQTFSTTTYNPMFGWKANGTSIETPQCGN